MKNANNINIENNTGTVNIFTMPEAKQSLTKEERIREVETLAKIDRRAMVDNYLKDHKVTYLDQIIIEDVFAHAGVVIQLAETRELEVRIVANIMKNALENIGYPAGVKREGISSPKIKNTKKIAVYTNTPIIVYHRAMASARKSISSMASNHIRTINMEVLKEKFPELYIKGEEVLEAKAGVADKLGVMVAKEIGMPYESFKKLAEMSEKEIVDTFINESL